MKTEIGVFSNPTDAPTGWKVHVQLCEGAYEVIVRSS